MFRCQILSLDYEVDGEPLFGSSVRASVYGARRRTELEERLSSLLRGAIDRWNTHLSTGVKVKRLGD